MCFVCYRFCQYNKSLLTSNKNIVKVWKAHVSKWGNYVLINSYYKSVTLCELEKVSFNFSENSVTKLEKSLLTRGLNFALPCKDIYYAEYILPFELLFRDVNLYEIPSYSKLVIRSRLRDCALTSFRYSGNINKNNLSKEEHLALKDLMKKRTLVIRNAGKGNTVVTDYISKIKFILSDSSKFPRISIQQNKVLKYIVHKENRIIDVLIKLKSKKIISEKKYEDP